MVLASSNILEDRSSSKKACLLADGGGLQRIIVGGGDKFLSGGENYEELGERRRERNRLLARQTRQRKKVFNEALQKQVAQLSKENENLKEIIQTRKNGDARRPQELNALQEKNDTLSLHDQQKMHTNVRVRDSNSILEKADYRLVSAIQAAQGSFCITNPLIYDNPIVFASNGFLKQTKYRLDQVMGRNCRFLQGPGTDSRQVNLIRNGISNGFDVSVCLLNYKSDGTPFYCQLLLAPLRDINHKVVNYVGVQVELKLVAQIPNHVGELSKITTLSIHMHQSKNQQQLEKLKEIFSSRNGTDSNTAENRGGEINHVQIHEVQLENRHADGSAVVSSSSTLSTVELGADMCHGDHVYEEEFRDCDGDALSMSRRDCRQETQDTPAALCEDCSALSPHENENSNRPLKRSSEMASLSNHFCQMDEYKCHSGPPTRLPIISPPRTLIHSYGHNRHQNLGMGLQGHVAHRQYEGKIDVDENKLMLLQGQAVDEPESDVEDTRGSAVVTKDS